MPTPPPADCAVSVCGFIFTRELPVYADWITWAGLAVVAYTLLMLALLNLRNYQRRERRANREPLADRVLDQETGKQAAW